MACVLSCSFSGVPSLSLASRVVGAVCVVHWEWRVPSLGPNGVLGLLSLGLFCLSGALRFRPNPAAPMALWPTAKHVITVNLPSFNYRIKHLQLFPLQAQFGAAMAR